MIEYVQLFKLFIHNIKILYVWHSLCDCISNKQTSLEKNVKICPTWIVKTDTDFIIQIIFMVKSVNLRP